MFHVFSFGIMEDLSSMWGNFTLFEKEDVEVHIGDGCADILEHRGQSCLVGKLLADRVVPKDFIQTHMMRAWKTHRPAVFKVLGENLFLMEFENDRDKTKVSEGKPWIFDGNLVVITDFDGFTPPSQMEFEKAAFWVRMYNLPLACMGQTIGHQIGSTVGVVEEVEAKDGEEA